MTTLSGSAYSAYCDDNFASYADNNTATPKATKNGNLDDKKGLDFAEMFYNGRIFIGANFRAV